MNLLRKQLVEVFVQQTREILTNQSLRDEWAKTNFELGLKYFSYGVARRKLRAIAVTQAMRFGALPEIPSVGEFLPGYEASSWFGVGVIAPLKNRA